MMEITMSRRDEQIRWRLEYENVKAHNQQKCPKENDNV